MAALEKCLASFSVLSSMDGKRIKIKLYKEDGLYIWRIGGAMGDPVDVLPKTYFVRQAKYDAVACYARSPVWKMQHNWNIRPFPPIGTPYRLHK